MTNLDQVATIISSFQSIQSFLLFSGWEIFATGQWRWREFNLWCSNSTRISRNKMHLTGAIFPCFPASVKHTGAGKVVYQGACCPPNCQREITCHLLNYVDLKKNCNSLNNRFIQLWKDPRQSTITVVRVWRRAWGISVGLWTDFSLFCYGQITVMSGGGHTCPFVKSQTPQKENTLTSADCEWREMGMDTWQWKKWHVREKNNSSHVSSSHCSHPRLWTGCQYNTEK